MTDFAHDGVDLDALLAKAGRVSEQAEVFYVRHRSEPVQFEANRLKMIENRESSGVALRIIKNGRIGFSSTSKLMDMDSLIEKALEVLPFGPEARLDFPSNNGITPVDVFDSRTESYPVERMVEMGQSSIDRLVAHSPNILCDATVSKSVAGVTILNSNGGSAEYTKSVFSVFVHGTIIQDTDMLFVSDGRSSCLPVSDTAEIVESIQTQLDLSANIVAAPAGERPVIFTPRGAAGALLGPLLAGFNGKNIVQGSSPLVGKLGEGLLDAKLRIWDEPAYPHSPGSRMCDDEGVPSRKLDLVENGVIAGFFYDLQTAGQAGVESTGAANRDLNTQPYPGASVIVMKEGDTAYQDMVGDIEDGLVVERLLGAGQSNILGGNFNANVLLGYRIENGRVTGRVKNTVISGNVYSILKNVQAIESESHWVGGSLKVPSLYLDKISVAAKM